MRVEGSVLGLLLGLVDDCALGKARRRRRAVRWDILREEWRGGSRAVH